MSKFRFDLKARDARLKMNVLTHKIGEMAVDYTKNVIFPSQSFNGKSWAPPKKELGRPLLQKTRTLYRSIRIMRSSARSVVWGTDVDYGLFHNRGTSRLPRRQFLGMDRKLKAMARQEAVLMMNRVMRRKSNFA